VNDTSHARAPAVVIGVGNSLRGDDGVGLAVTEALAALANSDRHEHLRGDTVEVVASDGEPTRLLELWRDRRLAIVIDAVVTGTTPGTLHVIDAATETLPRPLRGQSSHHAGLAEAVTLGRTLERMPDALTVAGVEPGDMKLGRTLSPAVLAAVPPLALRVSDMIASTMVALFPSTLEESQCT